MEVQPPLPPVSNIEIGNPATSLPRLPDRAAPGDPTAPPQIRATLDDNPELFNAAGSLGGHARNAWLELAAGNDHLAAEELRRRADEHEQQLLGGQESPLARLVVSRLVTCLVHLDALSLMAARAGEHDPQRGLLFERRLEMANKNYIAAIRAMEAAHRALKRRPKPPRPPSRAVADEGSASANAAPNGNPPPGVAIPPNS